MVASALKPNGIVFMMDSRRNSTGTASNQSVDTEGYRQQRILNDGQQFEIVKIYYAIKYVFFGSLFYVVFFA